MDSLISGVRAKGSRPVRNGFTTLHLIRWALTVSTTIPGSSRMMLLSFGNCPMAPIISPIWRKMGGS